MNSPSEATSGSNTIGILKERLDRIRKRKRAFGGQAVDMEALRRRIQAERAAQRRRGR